MLGVQGGEVGLVGCGASGAAGEDALLSRGEVGWGH